MSCNFPRVRAETFEPYTNQKGGTSYKVEWLERAQVDAAGGIQNLRKRFANKYRKIQFTPCGQCINCLLEDSRQKACQMLIHKEYGYHEVFDENGKPLDKGHKYPDGTVWFLTVTYKDEYLPTHKTLNTETGEIFEGISLSKQDHQDFIKRLRYAYPNMKIQYVLAGEYGSLTQRPHMHLIIYGLPLEQEQFKKVGVNKLGQPTWELKKLSEIWGNGFVNIGRVTWESAAYVARYTLKKAFKKDKLWYEMQGMIPEYIVWSNGIGKDFFENNYKEIYKTDSVPIYSKIGLPRPPKSYDRMLKEIDPKLYEEIKHKRDHAGRVSEKMENMCTDLTPEERRAISEARMKQVMKDIRMEV